ncbi:MAG: TrkH family potassium uptake protein [Caldicoprobacterales bacterium]|jgi:trk system potassium uptake protein TrkH|nr:TrkH family potassium uptake protein [Clostridiales bacterium]
MNYRMIFKSIGTVLCIEAACMLPSLLVAFIYREADTLSFAVSMFITAVTGFLLLRIKTPISRIYTRDGFAIVALGWLHVSAFGALPFLLSGSIPSVIDAFFESASGFSTTGASILRNVEALPKSILFWRSFTHWMGGIGVLILMIAILPSVNASTINIMKAESPGPAPGKLVPKIRQTAEILYIIYIVLTAIQVVLLLAGGMTIYDALIHAFGTASTGGFSSRNASVAAYSSVYTETVITVFMFLFGVNFTLYYMVFKRNIKSVLRDEELRFYFGVVITAIVLIVLNINGTVYQSIGESIRYAAFQVSSIITTTGYATADFNIWPAFSQVILVLLMFIGACAGSTGGGLKCIRVILLFKIIKREIAKLNHPKAVQTVKINGRIVDEETLSGVMAFFFFWILIFAVSVLIVSLDGKDLITSTTAVTATLNNIGPGLGLVGPVGNYADLSVLSKAVLSVCMIVGRLEIYPIMLLCFSSFWKRSSI